VVLGLISCILLVAFFHEKQKHQQLRHKLYSAIGKNHADYKGQLFLTAQPPIRAAHLHSALKGSRLPASGVNIRIGEASDREEP